MAHAGKLSRALEKSGAGDKLKSEKDGAVTSASSHPAETAVRVKAAARAVAPVKTPQSLPEIHRVTGCAGEPDYSVVMLSDRLGEVASQIRALRAKILAMNEGHPPRVLTITSGTRAEGKSTVTLNLATALSELESGRVLVIDGDILRPSQHLLANVTVETGLHEVLFDDDLPLDGNIYETAIHNLDLMPTRPITEDTDAESVLHRNCGPLLDKVRRHYAFVLIDAPPVMTGSQASTFGKKSDGVIMVARLESTPRHVVKRATEEIMASGAKVVGCILTQQKHHVPNFLYRFFGTPPPQYYHYGNTGD